jgi:flagella basal body P-ring formation protein FlgA
MIPLAPLALSACLAVNPGSDQILIRDLVGAFPGLVSVAPDLAVALAPAPGVERVFRLPELRRLAARFNLPAAPASEVCVVRPVSPPDPALFLAAMRRELPQATIEIEDYSRQPVPAGELAFPASSLRRAPRETLWIGYIRYAGNRRVAVWARVNLSIPVERVVAAADLAPNRPIDAAQLRLETRDESFSEGAFPKSISAVAGKWPRFAIRAGSSVRAVDLQVPPDVVRGETVHVEVRDGGALVSFDARAEASGTRGDTIPVSNPTSHRGFRARVEGQGRVSVDSSLPKVNP